jgi:hypothetical protein
MVLYTEMLIAERRRKDAQMEARQEHLVNLAVSQHAHFTGSRLVAQFGRWLVSMGCQFQVRYARMVAAVANGAEEEALPCPCSG